ncbi:MAG: hypothetical protein B7Y99_09760 [Caulobacterales bacterium 32-69-10]|nr:MAG: hypothetical protein B7Y99_09760 [Caulobacterales bacterium 32-69-10]
MLAAILAAVLAALPQPPTLDTRQGDWIIVTADRVVAPENMPGECFVQAKVDQVVHGENFRVGQRVALVVPCRQGGLEPTVAILGQAPPTIQTLRTQKRALVHLDAGGRVLRNGYYALSQAIPLAPALS